VSDPVWPPIRVTYTNWRGETRERHILPRKLWYGPTKWHPEPQYILEAEDLDDFGYVKDFAMSGFANWPGSPAQTGGG
jgi:hypothetical protein